MTRELLQIILILDKESRARMLDLPPFIVCGTTLEHLIVLTLGAALFKLLDGGVLG
jgi:hypothetical protein